MIGQVFLALMLFASSAHAQYITKIDPVIDEGGTSWMTLSFEDKDGNLVTPSSYCVTIDDEDSQLRLYSTCNASPSAAIVEVTIAPQAHRIVDENKALENHIVSITWIAGGFNGNKPYRIAVRNDPNIYIGPGPTPTGTITPAWTPPYGPTPFTRSTPTPR